MFGMKKRLAALPWPTRVVVGTLIFTVCSWIAMSLTVSIWLDALASADEENEIEYGASFWQFNGDFGAKDVSITHYFPDGTVGVVVQADRMVVHTPGLHWLWWKSFRGRSKQMPDSIGVTLENVRDSKRSDSTPGNYTNLPYDAMGCGTDMLTPAMLRQMGLPEPRRDVSFTIQRKDDSRSTLGMTLLTHGMGQLDLGLDVTLARPIPWRETLLRLSEARLQSATLRMKDLGFIAARNAYCGKAAGLTPASFQAYHQRAMSGFLAKVRLDFDAQTLARYRQFAENGGELAIASPHPPAMELPKFAFTDTFQTLERLPSTISYNDGPAATFRVNRVLVGEVTGVAASLPAAAAPAGSAPLSAAVAAPAAVANLAPVPAVAATQAVAAPALPAGTLTYKQMKGREGAHVEIVTVHGTSRRGTLLAYSAYLSTIRLDSDQGGFTMSIPGDSVLEVHALPPEPLQAGAASGGAVSSPGAPRD